MFTGILHTHTTAVILYLLIFTTKVVLLLINKKETLRKFRKKTLIIGEMIIPLIFIGTGIYLALNSGMVTVGNWFWLKIGLVLAIIPIGIIAFRKENKMLAVLGLLLFIYVYGISETKSPVFKNPIKKISEDKNGSMHLISTTEEKINIGNIVYNEKCTLCHGVDGKLQKSGSPDLSITKLSHEEIADVIANGKKNMATFKDQLSEQEIDAVAHYVQTLKKYAN